MSLVHYLSITYLLVFVPPHAAPATVIATVRDSESTELRVKDRIRVRVKVLGLGLGSESAEVRRQRRHFAVHIASI